MDSVKVNHRKDHYPKNQMQVLHGKKFRLDTTKENLEKYDTSGQMVISSTLKLFEN